MSTGSATSALVLLDYVGHLLSRGAQRHASCPFLTTPVLEHVRTWAWACAFHVHTEELGLRLRIGGTSASPSTAIGAAGVNTTQQQHIRLAGHHIPRLLAYILPLAFSPCRKGVPAHLDSGQSATSVRPPPPAAAVARCM
ncbi:hypothetical protein HYPSUDRAFT_209526 [Hypholoma sublateritium FD-334 SS-4]|uniref:Uncharacterized protein n=1 Tax=Hypholoma sublateritium (strain FD-334 SS-4) TaxID=945553 RepID=A0A0D2NA07_HYPSF|nr:hypothetical protein HYPSUDRAFT_209526 [Hypholoma sublateritium FD-334 SS-4]